MCAEGAANVHQIPFVHISCLSPEPDKLPDGVTNVGGALCAGHRLVEVRQLLRGDCDAPGALAQIVVLLQTLQ